MTSKLIVGDCLDVLKKRRRNSVDLIVTSPPYSNQRRYGSSAPLFRDDWHWLDWCAARFMECVRVSRGMVCFVVEGYTTNGTFHPLPEMLTMEVIRRGANIRHRGVYQRIGIMGGSPDALAQHHEIIVMANDKPGRLPFADPAALGNPPKYKPGGAPSHQSFNGRVNRKMPVRGGTEKTTIRYYKPPDRCKVSNVINCGSVGGGNMGSKLAHKNEAPFSERVPEVLIATYCPPGGTVLDPFCGSGTTGAAAVKLGRKFVGIENRESQIELTRVRIAEAQGC